MMSDVKLSWQALARALTDQAMGLSSGCTRQLVLLATTKRLRDNAKEITKLTEERNDLLEQAEEFDERNDEIEREARHYADQRAHEAHLATQAANQRARRAEDDARMARMRADDDARRTGGNGVLLR